MKELELGITKFGTKYYYIKGTNILHREDGPALEYADGSKIWYKKGKRHRLDGPAMEYSSGVKRYWIEGKHIKNVDSIEEALIKNLLE